MGQILHGSAKTTHAVRAAIQRSKATARSRRSERDEFPIDDHIAAFLYLNSPEARAASPAAMCYNNSPSARTRPIRPAPPQ